MRLNGWQRIGIVLSIVWALGAAIYQRSADVERASDHAELSYRLCAEDNVRKNVLDNSNCMLELNKNMAIWLEGSWANVAFVSLVPIPLGWLVVYVIIKIYRWVNVGFKREQPKKQPPT